MKRVYAPLGDNVTVEPLMFTESELDAQAFLSMMAVESVESAPLYMQVILVRLESFSSSSACNIHTSPVNSTRPWRKLYLQSIPQETGAGEAKLQSSPERPSGATNGVGVSEV
jgi:hypothetical protein